MDNPLGTTLAITAIGMTLLFLSLVLFYGIISLLTAATGERVTRRSIATAGAPNGVPESRTTLDAGMLQAAAIAIALARAEREEGTGGPVVLPSGDRDVTTWWSLHHQRRLADAGKPRRLG